MNPNSRATSCGSLPPSSFLRATTIRSSFIQSFGGNPMSLTNDTHIRHAMPLKERETLQTVVYAGKGIDDPPRLI